MFENTKVKLLSVDDFDGFLLRNKKCAVVVFFSEQCGHCKVLEKEYIKFASIAQFIDVCAINNKTGIIDNINNSQSNKFTISGYPTILFYKNGVPMSEYSGERTISKLLLASQDHCDESCNCN